MHHSESWYPDIIDYFERLSRQTTALIRSRILLEEAGELKKPQAVTDQTLAKQIKTFLADARTGCAAIDLGRISDFSFEIAEVPKIGIPSLDLKSPRAVTIAWGLVKGSLIDLEQKTPVTFADLDDRVDALTLGPVETMKTFWPGVDPEHLFESLAVVEKGASEALTINASVPSQDVLPAAHFFANVHRLMKGMHR